MFELIATAIRIDETIQVTIHGFLQNSSWKAEVTGIYPGNVVHIAAPNCTELYLGENEIPGSLVSLRAPMPWDTTVNIVDPKYNKIALFVNNQEIQRTPVIPMPVRFEVYALTTSEYWGYVITPPEHRTGRLFHRVFGPAPLEECVQWLNERPKYTFARFLEAELQEEG
jgi:hypothetical protein